MQGEGSLQGEGQLVEVGTYYKCQEQMIKVRGFEKVINKEMHTKRGRKRGVVWRFQLE